MRGRGWDSGMGIWLGGGALIISSRATEGELQRIQDLGTRLVCAAMPGTLDPRAGRSLVFQRWDQGTGSGDPGVQQGCGKGSGTQGWGFCGSKDMAGVPAFLRKGPGSGDRLGPEGSRTGDLTIQGNLQRTRDPELGPGYLRAWLGRQGWGSGPRPDCYHATLAMILDPARLGPSNAR